MHWPFIKFYWVNQDTTERIRYATGHKLQRNPNKCSTMFREKEVRFFSFTLVHFHRSLELHSIWLWAFYSFLPFHPASCLIFASQLMRWAFVGENLPFTEKRRTPKRNKEPHHTVFLFCLYFLLSWVGTFCFILNKIPEMI